MTAIVAACALLVVGWFAVGTLWNVRKGSAVMRWMHDGLPLLGDRTTVRWLGSTSVELAIANARPPFERVMVVIFLEPRDVPWMWALGHRRGRRDTLIVRGTLRSAPRNDLEILDASSWSGREALRRLVGEEWPAGEPGSESGMAVYAKTPAALAAGGELIDLSRRSGFAMRRLSVRRGERGFSIHLVLPAPHHPAGDAFRNIVALAEHASS